MSLHNLSNSIERALAAAGLDTRSGPTGAAVETIRKALEAANGAQQRRAGMAGAPNAGAAAFDVVDVEATWVEGVPTDETLAPAAGQRPPAAAGQFLALEHEGPHGRIAYKLYVPAAHASSAPMPLVVMLHGCKQDPDDFARGTRINELADEQGFLVAYPAQSGAANRSNCWNWFEPQHQTRAGPEPSSIVGIVRTVGRVYGVDERRVFAAGLSAGAAMAVILGESYPDVFAAVAAHSGLPHRAAHNVPSAFAAMHGMARAGSAQPPASASSRAVPTIVFHGEADTTVVPGNGATIAEQSVARLKAERGALTSTVEQRLVNGRRCTRTVHVDQEGLVVVEQWAVQGGGHAWFGGSRSGSFADPQGPDASREMMRFFALQLNQRSAAPEPAAG